jgi:hypothetical protein
MPERAIANNVRQLPVNPLAQLTTRLLKIPLSAIAEALKKDESAACRIRSLDRPCTLSEFCALLDVAGFKLVPKDKQCVPADELAMLRRVYAAHHNVDLWDDPE